MDFVDSHCHIIPGVDDGPAGMDESLHMGRLAAADGIKTIIATPHVIEGIYDGTDIDKRIEKIKTCFMQEKLDVAIVAGAEVSMSLALAADFENLRNLTIGDSDFLLVETAGTELQQLMDVVGRLRASGFYPVLAHPERTLYTVGDIERLCTGAAAGDVFLQVTAASITGLFGRKVQKKCMRLIKSGLVHLAATDAHSSSGRAPVMSAAFNILMQRAGRAAVALMQENPQRLLENKKPLSTGLDEKHHDDKIYSWNLSGRMEK